MIISGGENVYPKEVEDVLIQHPAVGEAAVIGVPHPVMEEQVIALIVPAQGTPAPSEAEILAFLRERLAGYKVPRQVRFVEDFPRTAIGKIQKGQLRERYGNVFEAVA
jgi:acyl-CoA synthetase (AMP-forming)/AMP-acid ligase II